MSLAINTDKIVAVLLHDGWHDVAPGSTTYHDAFELIDGGEYIAQPRAESTGLSFREADTSLLAGRRIMVPLNYVYAVAVKA